MIANESGGRDKIQLFAKSPVTLTAVPFHFISPVTFSFVSDQCERETKRRGGSKRREERRQTGSRKKIEDDRGESEGAQVRRKRVREVSAMSS